MPIIPAACPAVKPDDGAAWTSQDEDLLDLLALHVICGQLREARR